MLKSPFLSIIIPIYNNQNYIKNCLNSVLEQFDYSIEIIIIDDASTDNSFEISKKFLERNNKIHKVKLIKQYKNQGPGIARNIGIKKSTGIYLAFLDSDDILIKGFSKKIHNIITNKKFDIIEYGFVRFKSFKKLDKYNHLYSFSGEQSYKNIKIELFCKSVWYPHIRLSKRKLWKDVKFPNNYRYEDTMTMYKIYQKTKKIYFIDTPFLAYRYNPKSLTSLITKKNYDDMFKAFKSVKLEKNKIELKILKLRIARSICYFKNFLSIKDERYQNILKIISNLNLPMNIFFKLNFPDFLFYKFPSIYQITDKIRLKFKK